MRFLILTLFVFTTINFGIAASDTSYHYFKNGILSVKIEPNGDSQKIWVYHIMGDLIYEMENVRMSYSVSNRLFFRENGALEKVEAFFNPGASLYMYHSIIQFNEDNEPLYRVDHQTPVKTISEQAGKKFLWDRIGKRWIEQEVISCNPSKE